MNLAKRVGIEVRTIKKIDQDVIGKWLQLNSYQFRYDIIDFNYVMDIPYNEHELFNNELNNIKSRYPDRALWDISFMAGTFITKELSFAFLFEGMLHHIYPKIVESEYFKNGNEIIEFNIKVPKGCVYFSNGSTQFLLLEYNVKFKFSEFKERPLNPVSNYQYLNEDQNLVNRAEYEYDNPFGQKTSFSINHDVLTGKYVLTVEPTKES
jgi:hypothetical protein